MTIVPVTSADLDASEVSWFAALCSDEASLLRLTSAVLSEISDAWQTDRSHRNMEGR